MFPKISVEGRIKFFWENWNQITQEEQIRLNLLFHQVTQSTKRNLAQNLSINCLSRSFVSVQTKNSTSISRQNGTHNQNVNEWSENSQRSSSVVRNSFLIYRPNSRCTSIYETNTILSFNFLETSSLDLEKVNPLLNISNCTYSGG